MTMTLNYDAYSTVIEKSIAALQTRFACIHHNYTHFNSIPHP